MHTRTHSRIWQAIHKNGSGMTVQMIADVLYMGGRTVRVRVEDMRRWGTLAKLGERYFIPEK